MPDPYTQPGAVMRYNPRSAMAFRGDIQHDLRDFMLDRRLATLSDWVGEAANLYLRAARILRVHDRDALAISLAADHRFDARTLFVAHDHMAAHWRANRLPKVMAGRGKMWWGPKKLMNHLDSYGELMAIFRDWIRCNVQAWSDHRQDVLELFLLAVVGDHTRTGQAVEAELFHTLGKLYPVPGRTLPEPLPVNWH